MPSLEDFLGKPKDYDYSKCEIMYGTYGCQQCDENMDHAFFDPEALLMVWICSKKHESKIDLG
jgi:hypothetical protein